MFCRLRQPNYFGICDSTFEAYNRIVTFPKQCLLFVVYEFFIERLKKSFIHGQCPARSAVVCIKIKQVGRGRPRIAHAGNFTKANIRPNLIGTL